MSITVTGKLNRDAHQFQTGESTGFGVHLGIKYYDKETQSYQWSNYEAVVFSSTESKTQFYQRVLAKGSIVELTASLARAKLHESKNGPLLSIELLGAKLGFISEAGQSQPDERSATSSTTASVPII